MDEVTIQMTIDESKIHVYRYAQRMRDYAVKHLEQLLAEFKARRFSGSDDTIAEVQGSLDWLKQLEL